jgi:hypothetical protein
MAEFCKQCSEELFGKDFEDFKGLTTAEDWKADQAAVVICEGCGPIQVDSDGKCISDDCLLQGHKSPEKHPYLR